MREGSGEGGKHTGSRVTGDLADDGKCWYSGREFIELKKLDT